MKKYRFFALFLAVFALLALSSCDQITKFISDHTFVAEPIKLFNADRVATNYFHPNDTMYVQVRGLTPNAEYQVDCVDPDENVITSMTATADGDGVISPTPLWYEVGFKIYFNDTLNRWVAELPPADLGLKAFHVRIRDVGAKAVGSTDFKLPFFIVFSTKDARPKPIVNAARKVGSDYVIENAFDVGDELYVKVDQITDLPTPSYGKAAIYVVPFSGSFFNDGDPIVNYVARQEVEITELNSGVPVHITATAPAAFPDIGGSSWSTIPAKAAGQAFSVIVDVDGNGIYDVKKSGTSDYYLDGIDGNGVAGFIVKQPPIPPLGPVDYIPANIASGGQCWIHAWYEGWADYDYRDNFNADGTGTQYGWDWQYGGYGVKAIWNPYLSHDPQVPNSAVTGLYWGKSVDVYIMLKSAMTASVYAGTDPLAAAPGTTKMTMPVQYACTNGSSQQTIWRASWNSPMIVGEYCVVVDINRDGYLSNGDMVDNLKKGESTPSTGVGFNVVAVP